jgi:hypothetical protein
MAFLDKFKWEVKDAEGNSIPNDLEGGLVRADILNRSPDETYESVLLRMLLCKIESLNRDNKNYICDEQRWAALFESDEYVQAKRQITFIQ